VALFLEFYYYFRDQRLVPGRHGTGRLLPRWIYLENDGLFEHTQQMAGHESPRTTKLYDRTKNKITLSALE
jgi:hypothetical protein